MIFNQGYFHPMDRSYHAGDDVSESTGDPPGTNDMGIGIEEIGMSVPMGISAGNVQGVAVKIREGAGNLEIAFPGAVTGTRQAQTPGMYGEDTREALRELAKINEVNLTTHGAYSVMGLSGQDQQGNFSKEYRKLATDEIKRAIDFAADTQGGSVVVHTGEFERPISEERWAEGGDVFRRYDEEPEKAIVRVVDKRTGQVMTQVRKNQRIAVAEWLTADQDHIGKNQYVCDAEYKDIAGQEVEIHKGEYIDYEGNKIVNPMSVEHGRLPKYDKESGRFKVKMADWNYFVEEAAEWNKLKEEELGRSLTEAETMLPEERHIRTTLETNEGYARGWALNFSARMKGHIEDLKKLRKARDFYEKVWLATPEEDRWKLKEEEQKYGGAGRWIPPETKEPLELIDKQIWEMEQEVTYDQQSAQSQEKQAHDSRETQENVVSAVKYALDEARNAYAEAGMHAYEVTQAKNPDKPIAITMENIFPERYGAHPQELKTLVMNAREEMAKQLHERRGLSEEEAAATAANHIKATIDTGHFNMWKKYYMGTDQEFRGWLLEEVEDLAKSGIVGNVHLTDNFGYQDDHLAPGQGNTPVKEITKILKDHGYDGPLTVEPGADASTDLSDFHGLMKTWREFGSNVYGAGYGGGGVSHGPQQFGQIQHGYFGRNQPPYFIFGAYSPSNDWTLWSETPME